MSTFAVSIQAQIDALDAKLTSVSPTSVGADGTSVTNPDGVALSNQRIKLESILTKVNGGVRFPRGVVTGLR
jgi:hypothetical protein